MYIFLIQVMASQPPPPTHLPTTSKACENHEFGLMKP